MLESQLQYDKGKERQIWYIKNHFGSAGYEVPGSTTIPTLLRVANKQINLYSPLKPQAEELQSLALKFKSLKQGYQFAYETLEDMGWYPANSPRRRGMSFTGSLRRADQTTNTPKTNPHPYRNLDDLRNCNPDLLCQQLGGYQAELLLQLFGWQGWGSYP